MKRTFHIPSEGDLRKLVYPEHVSYYIFQMPVFLFNYYVFSFLFLLEPYHMFCEFSKFSLFLRILFLQNELLG